MSVRFCKIRYLKDFCQMILSDHRITMQIQSQSVSISRMQNPKEIYFLFLLPFFFVGCSLESSIQSLTKNSPEVFQKAQTAEVTSASSQNSYSTRGYKVQASVSYQNAKAEAVTGRGFKVYTNVQGTIFKE